MSDPLSMTLPFLPPNLTSQPLHLHLLSLLPSLQTKTTSITSAQATSQIQLLKTQKKLPKHIDTRKSSLALPSAPSARKIQLYIANLLLENQISHKYKASKPAEIETLREKENLKESIRNLQQSISETQIKIAETPKYPNDEILREITQCQRRMEGETTNRRKYEEIQHLRNKLKSSKQDIRDVARNWLQNDEGIKYLHNVGLLITDQSDSCIDGLPQDDITCIVSNHKSGKVKVI